MNYNGQIIECVVEWKVVDAMRRLSLMTSWALCFVEVVSKLPIGIGECTDENGQVEVVIAGQ